MCCCWGRRASERVIWCRPSASRRVRAARTIFATALKRGLIQSNPLADVKAGDQINRSRLHFVPVEVIVKVMLACPNCEWRLMVALARFGGVRCPSEILSLTWADIDWATKRITVPSPKTEHHVGGESRVIPIFPELVGPLREVQNAACPGGVFVITRYRNKTVNLRTQFEKIIKRAGVTPWPKLWQNLRASRETELADQYPLHVVCRWIGNSPKIAQNHYLQATDLHFKAATDEAVAVKNPPQNPPQQTAVTSENGRNFTEEGSLGMVISAGGSTTLTADSSAFLPIPPDLLGRAGIEPATHGFSVHCSTS
jgi:hypothetical protein